LRFIAEHVPLVQLILISGYPSSGKTYRSQQLVDYLNGRIRDESSNPQIARLKVHHVNDQSLGLSRDVYHTARAEKDARATEYSAVKRLLTRDDIVIADGLNYIKGFRYQLYCEAKAVQTASCVVSVNAPHALHARCPRVWDHA
jgi:protein KTI12